MRIGSRWVRLPGEPLLAGTRFCFKLRAARAQGKTPAARPPPQKREVVICPCAHGGNGVSTGVWCLLFFVVVALRGGVMESTTALSFHRRTLPTSSSVSTAWSRYHNKQESKAPALGLSPRRTPPVRLGWPQGNLPCGSRPRRGSSVHHHLFMLHSRQ